jgi:hypothetical protein
MENGKTKFGICLCGKPRGVEEGEATVEEDPLVNRDAN